MFLESMSSISANRKFDKKMLEYMGACMFFFSWNDPAAPHPQRKDRFR
jgi:hypothetical protein